LTLRWTSAQDATALLNEMLSASSSSDAVTMPLECSGRSMMMMLRSWGVEMMPG
jgi:hypothetical protein